MVSMKNFINFIHLLRIRVKPILSNEIREVSRNMKVQWNKCSIVDILENGRELYDNHFIFAIYDEALEGDTSFGFKWKASAVSEMKFRDNERYCRQWWCDIRCMLAYITMIILSRSMIFSRNNSDFELLSASWRAGETWWCKINKKAISNNYEMKLFRQSCWAVIEAARKSMTSQRNRLVFSILFAFRVTLPWLRPYTNIIWQSSRYFDSQSTQYCQYKARYENRAWLMYHHYSQSREWWCRNDLTFRFENKMALADALIQPGALTRLSIILFLAYKRDIIRQSTVYWGMRWRLFTPAYFPCHLSSLNFNIKSNE